MSFPVSMGQEFRNGQAGSSGLGSSVTSLPWSYNYMLAWATAIWRLNWGWKICFQDGALVWLVCWCWLLGGRPQLSACGALHSMVHTVAASSLWASDPIEQAKATMLFMSWPSFRSHTVSSARLYWSQRPPWFSVGGDYTRMWIPAGQHHWRSSWRLANTDTKVKRAFCRG